MGQYHVRVGDSKTDPLGGFRVAGLSVGEFVLHADAEGMRGAQQQVVIGETVTKALVIRLEPCLELRGRVETADGSPAAGLRVSATPSSQSFSGMRSAYSRTQTDANGRFVFDRLGPGTQSVSARSEDGMTAETTAEVPLASAPDGDSEGEGPIGAEPSGPAASTERANVPGPAPASTTVNSPGRPIRCHSASR